MATSKTTQDFIRIKEVKDGIAILKDGSMRAIIMTSSLNFALKSEDEQNSIIFQFQNFLNSINFSVQICVQSRRLDIRPYVALLEERQKDQTNELMKIQTREYVEFIKTFTDSTNIMTKSFFVVIPYTPAKLSVNKSMLDFKFLNKSEKKDKKEVDTESFEEHRTQIEQRVSIVQQGIISSGIRAVQLGTEEVIEMYYKVFNPGEVDKPITITET